MKLSRYLASTLMSLTVFVFADLAEAGPVSVSFSGEIDGLPASPTGPLASLMPGDAFVGTFQVDFNRARVTVNDLIPQDVFFSDVILVDSLNLRVGDLTFAAAPDAIATFIFRNGPRDFLLFPFQFAMTPGSSQLFQIEFLFENFSGSFFDDRGELLPDDLSRFDRTMLRIFPVDPITGVSSATVVTGKITAASVPEPAGPASLAIALVALALLRLRPSRAENEVALPG